MTAFRVHFALNFCPSSSRIVGFLFEIAFIYLNVSDRNNSREQRRIRPIHSPQRRLELSWYTEQGTHFRSRSRCKSQSKFNKELNRRMIKVRELAFLCHFRFHTTIKFHYQELKRNKWSKRSKKWMKLLKVCSICPWILSVPQNSTFSPILIGLNWSRGAILFIRGETLSAHRNLELII